MNRNDKCSCGSGKKFKKCCGYNPARVVRCATCQELKSTMIVENGDCPSCRMKKQMAEQRAKQPATHKVVQTIRPAHAAIILGALLGSIGRKPLTNLLNTEL